MGIFSRKDNNQPQILTALIVATSVLVAEDVTILAALATHPIVRNR